MRLRQPRSPEPHPDRSQSTRQRVAVSRLVTALLAAALEALPVAAWLDAGAALAAGSSERAALPFWFVYAVVLVAALLGWLTNRPSIAVAPALIAVGWLAALFVALRLAPGAYAPIAPHAPLALGWVTQVIADGNTGSSRLAVGAGLLVLNSYLWWRGLTLGRDGAQYDRLWLVFRLGLVAIVCAIVVTVTASGAAQAGLGARLAVLLPLEVGAGLMALTLVHVAAFERARTPRDAEATPTEGAFVQTPWLLTAFALAGAVVLAALLLALALSYNTLLAIAQALRPVGDALGVALAWLVELVAYLVFVVLYWPIEWVLQLRASEGTSGPRITIPNPPKLPGNLGHPAQGLPANWVVAGRWVVFVGLALVALFVLYRVLRLVTVHPVPDGADETREALDARSLLLAQLRALFGRRAPGPVATPEEGLGRRSVRRLYRNVLRAALRAGRGRAAAETPWEYQRRLVTEMGDSGASIPAREALPADDLVGLTRQYEQARYAEQAEDPATEEEARARERRLSAWFARGRAR